MIWEKNKRLKNQEEEKRKREGGREREVKKDSFNLQSISMVQGERLMK